MVTLKDIAKEAGVPVYTVSRILNGRYKDKWDGVKLQSEKVKAIATRLNYVPNSAARAMQRQSFKRIGIIIPGRFNAMYDFEKIIGINDVLQEHDYTSSIICLDDLQKNTAILKERTFDGIAVSGFIYPQQVESVFKLSPNCVWIDNNQFSSERSIKRDEYYAGATVANEVLKKGYKKVIYITKKYQKNDSAIHFCHQERFAGVSDIINRSNEIDFRIFDINSTCVENMKLSPDTAIIVFDMSTTEEIVFKAMAQGLCAGRDFALASCDSNEKISNVWPGLSRMKFNRKKLGIEGAKMLLQIIENNALKYDSLILKDEWFKGETLPSII